MERRQQSVTLKDPAAFSTKASSSRLQSFSFALSGCAYMLRHQKNTRIMTLVTCAVLGTGWWLGIDADSWATLCLAIALVWVTEFVNGAIEAAVDLSTETYHALARKAKDVAAGAVLLAAVGSAIVGFLILGPPVLEKIGDSFAMPFG
ncbi:MAG: diacylglycerol kinase family protein [Chloroflexi bacterium]|nr:diacylglycerol kinase family protein [Chloroflexota bacterium]